jgi:hypothetical protein
MSIKYSSFRLLELHPIIAMLLGFRSCPQTSKIKCSVYSVQEQYVLASLGLVLFYIYFSDRAGTCVNAFAFLSSSV